MEIFGGLDGSSGLGSSRLVSLNDAPHRAKSSIRFDQVRILANRLLSLSLREMTKRGADWHANNLSNTFAIIHRPSP